MISGMQDCVDKGPRAVLKLAELEASELGQIGLVLGKGIQVFQSGMNTLEKSNPMTLLQHFKISKEWFVLLLRKELFVNSSSSVVSRFTLLPKASFQMDIRDLSCVLQILWCSAI